METTIKYTIKRLETVLRKSDEVEVVLVKAKSKDDQVIEIIDIDLTSLQLGDELEITVKNNGPI